MILASNKQLYSSFHKSQLEKTHFFTEYVYISGNATEMEINCAYRSSAEYCSSDVIDKFTSHLGHIRQRLHNRFNSDITILIHHIAWMLRPFLTPKRPI